MGNLPAALILLGVTINYIDFERHIGERKMA
jgi:hypothetical protein